MHVRTCMTELYCTIKILSKENSSFLQTNGLTERFNQTLTRSLAKVVNDSHTDWDEKLETILMGYRASKQASTKHSPYFMCFQKDMRLPIDNEMLPSAQDDVQNEDNIDQRIQMLLSSREKSFKEVKTNITCAQKKQKETYDRKHLPDVLAEGTKVLLENTKEKQRKGGKMEPLWLGPYFVSRDIGKGLYELKNNKGNVMKMKANIKRLKIYTSEKKNFTSKSM